ncbi:hypothetical protein [Halococcus sp. IIIV-5B]|uniref:hypothetical protein n=1 Tax=Halococcus sp. IIIV-5B TaxID=2321230 RepID=UPI000E74CE66|nr:hypothetical protein [Halococcus sp. IIIV-5B]RJS96611.1 hypothetical protein D3261_18950 [Halococcus sp. IIIV-5B]
MTDKKQIAGYVSRAEYRTISAKAESEDRSISSWVAEAASEKIEREGLESAGAQYQIERRLMSMVDQAADRAADRIVEELSAPSDGDPGDDYYDWGDES